MENKQKSSDEAHSEPLQQCSVIGSRKAQWKVNTPSLLNEILNNNETSIFNIPINIFSKLLADVATRASELNDDKLNALMCRLALYEISDPYSKDFDEKFIWLETFYPYAKSSS